MHAVNIDEKRGKNWHRHRDGCFRGECGWREERKVRNVVKIQHQK